VNELLEIYIENRGRIGVCPPCAKTHGVTENNIIGSAELMGAIALLDKTVVYGTTTGVIDARGKLGRVGLVARTV